MAAGPASGAAGGGVGRCEEILRRIGAGPGPVLWDSVL